MGRFTLTLEVDECGVCRTYTASGESECQTELGELLSLEIATAAKACCGDPPCAYKLAYDMSEAFSNKLLHLLKAIHDAWSGDNNLEDCVSIIVDWEHLNYTPTIGDIRARSRAETLGAMSADPGCVWASADD